MIITHKINMDLKNQTKLPAVSAVQGDAFTRWVEITLLDDGAPCQIPDGVDLLVRYVRADGTGGEYDSLPQGEAAVAVSGNVVSLILTPQVLTVAGMVQVTVTLILDALMLNTFRFLVNVHPNAGARVESDDGYCYVRGFLPMPEAAAAEQFIRVEEVDSQGIVRKVEGIMAEDVPIWVPEAQSVDLTGMSADVSRRTIMLGGPVSLGNHDAWRIRSIAVQAAPGVPVRFGLFQFRETEGVLVKADVIGEAVADADSGLAVWSDEGGHWVREDNMVVLAMADSAAIRCHQVGTGMRVTGQLKFEDGDHYSAEEGLQIPCTVVTGETAQPGDIWYALYAVEMEHLSRKTVGQYLLDTGTELAALDRRIDTILPATTTLDNGKVLTVVHGEYVLEKPSVVQSGGLPEAAVADHGKILQVVNGTYRLMEVADSSVAAFLDAYMEEALGGDY